MPTFTTTNFYHRPCVVACVAPLYAAEQKNINVKYQPAKKRNVYNL